MIQRIYFIQHVSPVFSGQLPTELATLLVAKNRNPVPPGRRDSGQLDICDVRPKEKQLGP